MEQKCRRVQEREEENIKGKEKNIQMAIIRRSVSVTSLRLYNKAREYIYIRCVYVCACVCVCAISMRVCMLRGEEKRVKNETNY